VPKNEKEAIIWYNIAAEQGNRAAIVILSAVESGELIDAIDYNPRLIIAVPPVYPFKFKREGIEGLVMLVVIIDERGKVIRATVKESSRKEFEKPAIEAVLQWKFEPGIKNGKPVKVRRVQPISFKLN